MMIAGGVGAGAAVALNVAKPELFGTPESDSHAAMAVIGFFGGVLAYSPAAITANFVAQRKGMQELARLSQRLPASVDGPLMPLLDETWRLIAGARSVPRDSNLLFDFPQEVTMWRIRRNADVLAGSRSADLTPADRLLDSFGVLVNYGRAGAPGEIAPLLRRTLAAVDDLPRGDTARQGLAAELRALLRRNLDRVEGRLHDGYSNYPDHAELGRAAATAELLTRLPDAGVDAARGGAQATLVW